MEINKINPFLARLYIFLQQIGRTVINLYLSYNFD